MCTTAPVAAPDPEPKQTYMQPEQPRGVPSARAIGGVGAARRAGLSPPSIQGRVAWLFHAILGVNPDASCLPLGKSTHSLRAVSQLEGVVSSLTLKASPSWSLLAPCSSSSCSGPPSSGSPCSLQGFARRKLKYLRQLQSRALVARTEREKQKKGQGQREITAGRDRKARRQTRFPRRGQKQKAREKLRNRDLEAED